MKFGERLSLGMMLNWRKKKERRMKRREVEREKKRNTFLPWYSTFLISPQGKEILGESWSSCS